jgi:hypothetical protein
MTYIQLRSQHNLEYWGGLEWIEEDVKGSKRGLF